MKKALAENPAPLGSLSGCRRTTILLRNEQDARRLLPFQKAIAGNQIKLVALAPGAILALEHQGLPFVIPEDFYSAGQLASFEAGVRTNVLRIVRDIDELLAARHELIRRFELQPATFHLRVFDNVISSLARTFFQIANLIGALQPDRIGIFDCGTTSSGSQSEIDPMFWSRSTNLVALILKSLKAEIEICNLAFEDRYRFGADKPDDANADRPDSLWQWPINYSRAQLAKSKSIIARRPRWNYLLTKLRRQGIADLRKELLSKKDGLSLLLLKGAYDWEIAEKALNANGIYFHGQLSDDKEVWAKISQFLPSPTYLEVLNQLTRTPSFRRHFLYDGVDLFPIIYEKLRYFFETVVPMAVSAYRHTVNLLESKKINAVAFAINPSAVSKSITWAAKRKGIPVIGWQHGDANSETYYTHALSELLGTDMFMTWGEGSRRHRLKHHRGLNCRMEAVGSALLGALAMQSKSFDKASILRRLAGKMPGDKKVIVYATTNYYLNYSYSPFSPPWSDNLLCRTQQTIIRALAGMDAVKIVKLHPNRVHLEPALVAFCKSHQSDGIVTVINQSSFEELLSVADAVVLDVPTTTLLQAVVARKPVFCLSTHRKFSEAVAAMLGKRAVLEDKPEVLMKRLQAFVTDNIYQPDCNDTEFLQFLGAPLDARGCELLAKRIKKFIMEFQPSPAQEPEQPKRRRLSRHKKANDVIRSSPPVA